MRFSTPIPAAPSGVAATAGDKQVSLSWTPAAAGAAYRVYYGTTPGVTPANGTVINVQSPSTTVTALANDTTYYFVVAALSAGGESTASAEVSATPTLPGPFAQQDLEGVWNFNVLVSGSSAGWMRGALTVGSTGAVSFTLYQDSARNTSASAALFPALFLNPSGEVRDGSGNLPGFRGVMAANRALVVGSGPWSGSDRYLAVLQKQLPIVFTAADLQGFGSPGGGGRRFVYHQISTGPGGEWEWAAGQLGRDQKVQYAALSAPSNPSLPADKATILNISTDGIVTEGLAGAVPAPALVIDRAVMSGDKTLMVGTATDSSRLSLRFVLRIYQMMNIVASDPNTFAAADLAGSYQFQKLISGTTALTASGTLAVDPSGAATYASYADSAGSTTPPAGFSTAMTADGVLTTPGDSSLHGKLSYLKDILVLTRSDGTGSSLTIAVKR